MKINKMLWISALILILSIPSAFAAIGLFENPWFIFAVNVFIIWIVLFILQAYLLPEKLAKVKAVIWIAVFVAAVLIAYFIAGGAGYIWQIGLIAPFLGWIAINTIIIAAIGYFGLGLLDAMPQKNEGKIGVALLIILFSGMIALEIGDKFILHTDNAKAFWKYLFEHETQKEVKRKVKVGDTEKEQTYRERVGGILRPEGPPEGQYRLFVFLGAALMFSWFFISFGIVGNYPKLSYLIAAIIAANLARQGTGYEIVIRVAEVLFFLIIIKQIPADMVAGFTGGFAPIIRWLMAALLVGYIFCTVFQQSYIISVIGKPIDALTGNKLDIGKLVGCKSGGEPVDEVAKERIDALKKAAEKAAGDKGYGIGNFFKGVLIAIAGLIIATIIYLILRRFGLAP